MDNDPKDRHVAAAAVYASADTIVTNNLGDFVSTRVAIERIDVITPGVLVDRLLDESPEIVVVAVREMAGRWVNQPRSYAEILSLLAVHPTPRQAHRSTSRCRGVWARTRRRSMTARRIYMTASGHRLTDNDLDGIAEDVEHADYDVED